MPGLVDPASVGARPRTPPRQAEVPTEVAAAIGCFLTKEAGLAPARARAMLTELARLRAWCCPAFDEVAPGQVAWLAGSVGKHKRPGLPVARRVQVPVVLTLFTGDVAEGRVEPDTAEHVGLEHRQPPAGLRTFRGRSGSGRWSDGGSGPASGRRAACGRPRSGGGSSFRLRAPAEAAGLVFDDQADGPGD